jgi:hypothetical protein
MEFKCRNRVGSGKSTDTGTGTGWVQVGARAQILLWVEVHYWEKSRFRKRCKPGGSGCACLAYLVNGTVPTAIPPWPIVPPSLSLSCRQRRPPHAGAGLLLRPRPTAHTVIYLNA